MLVQNKILITNGRSSVAIRSRPVHAPFDSFAFPSRIFFSHNFFAVEEKLELQPRVNLAQPRIRSFFFSSPLSKMDSKLFLFLYRFRYLPRCLRVFYFLLHFFSLWISILGIIIGFIGDTRAGNISERRGKKKSRILRSPSRDPIANYFFA